MANSPSARSHKVFVKNVDLTYVTEDTLTSSFSVFGEVMSAKVFRYRNPSTRGYGHVSFTNEGDANRALREGNGIIVGRLPIRTTKYVPKHKLRSTPIAAQTTALIEPHFECQICFSSLPKKLMVDHGCDHHFCSDCMKNHFQTLIGDGNIASIKCPNIDCEKTSDETLIKSLVTEEVFLRYERLMLKSATKYMEDIINCPNPKCEALLEIEGHLLRAHCSRCEMDYCTNCLRTYHGLDIECEPTMTSTQSDKASELLKKKICKDCPKCKVPIEKNLGCDHMTCVHCKHQFCWLCLTDWTLIHKCLNNTIPIQHITPASMVPPVRPRFNMITPTGAGRVPLGRASAVAVAAILRRGTNTSSHL